MTKILFSILSIILFVSSDFKDKNDEKVIAVVAGKVITRNDFFARSEYTPRPDYCKLDNYTHKKIILNTLIAEQLMSKEAGDDNELTQSKEYKTYLMGRKEQAMRQIHYYEKAYKNSYPDSFEIDRNYDLAGRTYSISYFRVRDSLIASTIHNSLVSGNVTFPMAYNMISMNDSIPKKEISYFNNESLQISSVLFERDYSNGEILKPIFVDDSYLIIKIDGWKDKLAISNTDKAIRLSDVKLKLTEEKALKLYTNYVSELMKGKKVDFVESIFKKLVETMAPFYLKNKKQKELLFNKSFWKESNENEVLVSHIDNAEFFKNSPLLNYDSETWDVEKLLEEIQIHPLVFRKNELRKDDFALQLKLAIVDLIRDKEITKDAYKNGFEKNELVIKNVNMWSSNLLANFQKYGVLKSNYVEGKSKSQIFEDIMNPYIKSLQNKYSNEIKINIDEFEKIIVSRIDMLALQTDMAFPFIVPLFPELTTLSKLDYGGVMK